MGFERFPQGIGILKIRLSGRWFLPSWVASELFGHRDSAIMCLLDSDGGMIEHLTQPTAPRVRLGGSMWLQRLLFLGHSSSVQMSWRGAA